MVLKGAFARIIEILALEGTKCELMQPLDSEMPANHEFRVIRAV